MSAQRSSQLSTSSQSSSPQPSRGGQRNQQTALSRQSSLSSLHSVLLNPFGFFDDDPFSVIRRMQRELNRAFSQSGAASSSRGDDLSDVVWVPPVEVAVRDNNFVVSAELPGLSDEDVTVEIRDDAIVIQGERQFEREEDQGGIRRTERRYGRFYREIPLPDGADPEQATAEINNGVLQITVAISQAQSSVRQIPVQSTTSAQSDSSRTGDQTSSASGSSQSASSQSSDQRSSTTQGSSGQKAA
jgi:HSP20 family protein